MDCGIGIALAGASISAAAVIITAIKVKANGNGKTCSLHSGIEATLKFLAGSVERIEKKIDDVLGGN